MSTSASSSQTIKSNTLVQKRDGRTVEFDPSRIETAIEKAFRADRGTQEGQQLDKFSAREVREVTNEAIAAIGAEHKLQIGIEEIQDLVEMRLMQRGHYSVARRYIVYRENRSKARSLKAMVDPSTELDNEPSQKLLVRQADGIERALDWGFIAKKIEFACAGLTECNPNELVEEVSRSLYNHMTQEELERSLILAARTKIEKDPQYQNATARLLLDVIYNEVLGEGYSSPTLEATYKQNFEGFIKRGVNAERLTPEILVFDINKISQALKPDRDNSFLYIGLQTIYDRYLLHINGRRIETPQYFWMRVAMGLAIREDEKEARAIEFYNLLSTFRFVSSTPTLFNAGTLHPQLSSCYLTTIEDDLEHIFKCISDNAKLSKWAGGLGNDWTAVRATGAKIKGTNGESQGVVPFLKVANDTAIAVNQGGKRKGAMCAYLETWHLEIEEFLELRKNTGDDRRRTHDMNTANWIPDLFMQRVMENGTWTLFSPNETPELHDIYGIEFKKRYEEYEQMAQDGLLKQYRQIPAVTLWRKMLSMVFETGHPWITFKDPSNLRSPQSHVGVVHSSNLCTEILLNTSKDETAVCNLGSINFAAHIKDGKLSQDLVKETINTALRMLDNVIDINFYPTAEAKTSNLKHRPVGLGIMGFQDALYELGISYQSDEAIEFADYSMEVISYYAILASTELAKERGAYSSYRGSKWHQGLLPIDTLDILEKERGDYLEVDRSSKMDWTPVRDSIKKYGMRNSNVMAIAPTATIGNISGVTQSIEPTFRNLYVKSNLSGEFTVVNPYLVKDLKDAGMWDDEMIDDLKYNDGVVAEINRIPQEIRDRYATAFEIDPRYLIECASRRQKWIDMGQSLNLYIASPSGKALDEMYKYAWLRGLKTTYYLRSLGATQIEKSNLDINKRGIQPKWMKSKSASSDISLQREADEIINSNTQEQPATEVKKACSIEDPECEACQ
jgi:ribonucleoside-diphosphate reductase alpha chain